MQNDRLWEAAQRIAALDWRLGDPLLLLHDLSDERFELVLAEPPLAATPGWPPNRAIPGDGLTSRISSCGARRG